MYVMHFLCLWINVTKQYFVIWLFNYVENAENLFTLVGITMRGQVCRPPEISKKKIL